MLGFLKKKKKKDHEPEKNGHDPALNENKESQEKTKAKGKRRKLPIKWILICLLILALAGASGFVVYKLWFSGSTDKSPVYAKKELAHVGLPEEMVHFCFTYFPDLYNAINDYNREVILIEREIARIQGIGDAYPEQQKIADKEKKVWEKELQTLKKAFIKIEKPVKEAYVLFRVNENQGLAKIKELESTIAQEARTALKPAQDMTGKLKTTETVPEGLLKGTLFKLKKKFL